MSADSAPDFASAAAAMRDEFDQAFARGRNEGTADPRVDVLSLRAAGRGFAVRLSEIAGVHVECSIVPVPATSPVAGFMGVVAVRGQLAPVFHLGALLEGAPVSSTRWLILVRGPAPVALAFDAFAAHERVNADAISVAPSGAAAVPYVRGAVRLQDAVLPLVDLAALVEAIVRRGPRGPAKE